ncbi:hypothetical protein [Solitalea canadensis]|uniref:Uncharacterized protein n=1 Tax=Solitalea canadensis (strain ATCC 29591 / DSM 3403 / JCM 21819 / LMG 8368 / NBRC 15130 / NCIMB 12057 / USAM 9D) TaxID=929556 RepID=H8KL76_SOLCM|nr:hypothetical protein [Solitalea canadensis]AFD09159.1 hypothetical protein Solca_4169 [Solitalea canadensis DSM 3403]
MIRLTTKIENIEQLRAEKARLKILADDKEAALNRQFKEINERIKPAYKALGFFMGNKSGEGSMLGSAFMTGIKSIFPYLLTSLLTGKKRGFFGAITAVGGDLLLKNLSNIDINKVAGFVSNLFKGKKKDSNDPIDWEHEIYT